MSSMQIGAYVDKKSVVHNLDARIKLLLYVALLILVLLSKSIAMYAIDALLIIICIAISKLNILSVVGFVKRLWLFFVLIILMNALFYSSDNILISFGAVSISMSGIVQGLKIIINVSFILMWSNILLSTTTPISLMESIRFYLSPFKLIKLPVDDITLIVSVAIQFIPILMQESAMIKKAQIARGASFESKNVFKKAGAIVPLVVPVFVSAFKRADELSQALEARGYQGGN